MRRHPVGLILVALACLVGAHVRADTLYVTEYQTASPVIWQAAVTPPVRSSVVAIAASSAQSPAFLSNTRIVRLHCDVACFLEVGGMNPTATTSSARLVAGQTEYFYVTAGDKVAVLIDSTP